MDENKNFILNIRKSPTDERDYVAETIFVTESEDLPEIYDLRTSLLSIRDQGATSQCAGFASSCMKEWQEKLDVNFADYMSPTFIYNNRVNQDSEGMYSRDVMKILNKIGSVSEKDYPFGVNDPITDELKAKASQYKIKAYASVTSIDGLKKALIKNGPCYFAVPVYNYTWRMWKPRQGDDRKGGHAMAVVGWNAQGFIIRNSWGKNWGFEGYTIFPYEDWGLHWEAWTTIDDESGSPLPPQPKKKKRGGLIAWLFSFCFKKKK